MSLRWVFRVLLCLYGGCALWRYRNSEEDYEHFTSRNLTFEDKERYLPADHSNCFMSYVTAASWTDRKFLWNPETDKHQNYRSCFVFHQNSASEGLPKTHQILNSSLNNYTVWATSQSAIYVFRVRKLDQNYRSDTPRIILYSIIMLFIFLEVIVSYKYTTTKIETLSFQEN
ncbi:cation channel sperm-associated auxiliary subunit epsilon isoform X1 [Heliangelus exortis]|uniref:cation channel sperm-associated auxiliary subunit epsilon isoform X1 n=1 Tax=Heliangelus exortis TaxID=472823 RepID=UPI003A91BE07